MLYIHQTTNPQYRILGAHRGPRPQRASVGVPGSVVFGLARLLPGAGPLSSDLRRALGHRDACTCRAALGQGEPCPAGSSMASSSTLSCHHPSISSTHSSSQRDPPRPPVFIIANAAPCADGLGSDFLMAARRSWRTSTGRSSTTEP